MLLLFGLGYGGMGRSNCSPTPGVDSPGCIGQARFLFSLAWVVYHMVWFVKNGFGFLPFSAFFSLHFLPCAFLYAFVDDFAFSLYASV